MTATDPGARNYPLPAPGDDVRFTFGLASEVKKLIEQQGYPALTGRDLVALQLALFEFLYTVQVQP